MFFVLSKTLDLAFEPLAWVIALVGLGLFLFRRRSHRRRLATGSLVAAIIVLLIAGNPMVANRLWWMLERDAPSSYRADVEYDVVVLLGGLVPTGLADPTKLVSYGDSVERLLVTFDLLRTGKAKVAIISGGVPDPPPGTLVEAALLAKQLEDWGIARERLIIDERALNTRQNAIETARIVRERGIRSVLVVTSAFHMERSVGCFRAAELPVDTLPVDRRAIEPGSQGWFLSPRSFALEMTSAGLRELSGRIIYRTLGYAR